jgi:hypothetical protein
MSKKEHADSVKQRVVRTVAAAEGIFRPNSWFSRANIVESMRWMVLHRPVELARLTRIYRSPRQRLACEEVNYHQQCPRYSRGPLWLYCECRDSARLSRFCGSTRMIPLRGLSISATRKSEMERAIGKMSRKKAFRPGAS